MNLIKYGKIVITIKEINLGQSIMSYYTMKKDSLLRNIHYVICFKRNLAERSSTHKLPILVSSTISKYPGI